MTPTRLTNLDLDIHYPKFILPAIKDDAHYTINPAGRQVGKTYNYAQWISKETIEYNCRSLWIDTVHTNIDKYVERYFRPILKPVILYCDWNAQKKILKLPNGTIDFGSAQKPENLEGFNYKRTVLNEAGHILRKPALWHNTLKAMIKSEDNKTKVVGVPKGRGLFEELYLLGLEDGNDEYSSYRYTVYDSPYWTKKQIEDVRKDTPELIWKQEYMASFESFAGLIYPDFNREVHCLIPPDRKLTDIFFVVLDPGWEHPTACILAKETVDRTIFILDEFREQHLHVGDITRQIRSMLVRNGLTSDDIESFVIDPASKGTQQTSGQSIYDQLQEEGWGFVPANNGITAGISRVTRLLRNNKIFFNKNRCQKIIDEMGTYHWKEFSDGTYGANPTPYKVGDDLVDCVKYLALSRPDYFEHPKLDVYGRLLQDGADPVTGFVAEEGTPMDIAEDNMDTWVDMNGVDDMME